MKHAPLNFILLCGILFAIGCLILFFLPAKSPTPLTVYAPVHTSSTFAEPSLPPLVVTTTSISILNVGDIMLDRQVKTKIDTYGEEYPFSLLTTSSVHFFDGYDIVSGNLEGPFANTRRTTTKQIAFWFDPALLPMLKKTGFTIFSQANNHSYDMGRDGFRESIENIQNAGFLVYGEQYQVTSTSLLVHEVGSRKVAFIGVNDTNRPISLTSTVALIDEAEQTADITVINAHWGEEYKALSSERQQQLAHAFIDAGADAIIGHHPHWVEEMEIYKERPIFYSLGNFLFDQYFSKSTQEGLAVGVTFSSEEIAVDLFPVRSVLSQVRRMSEEEEEVFLPSFIDRSRFGDYSGSTTSIRIPISSYAF